MTGKRWNPQKLHTDLYSPMDIELAKNGLAISKGISPNTKRIGIALLEHLNRKTGRCDPGIETLRKGLGISRATVFRGLGELCGGEDPLIVRVVHGGTYNKNRYIPNLEKLQAPVLEYQRKAGISKPESCSEQSQHMKPSPSQYVKSSQYQHVTPKPIERTKRKTREELACEKRVDYQVKPKQQAPSNRNKAEWKRIRTKTKKEIAIEEAVRRISRDIAEREQQRLYGLIERKPEAYEKAKQLEVKRKGFGIEYLISLSREIRDR